jgi:hypothetical protein
MVAEGLRSEIYEEMRKEKEGKEGKWRFVDKE